MARPLNSEEIKKLSNMSEWEIQNLPLPNEVDPKNAFTIASIAATHFISAYKLNDKPETVVVKKNKSD